MDGSGMDGSGTHRNMDAGGAGELERLIAEEIAESGPITFARFMELALYHPRLGYYAGGGAGREPLGWSGDYFTSGDVHPLWGWALARQLHQMWELLGCPVPFDVLEPGAGRGLLAVEVWRYALERAPEWAAALRYTLADRAPADSPLRAAREGRLSAALDALGAPPERIRWVGDPATAFATRSPRTPRPITPTGKSARARGRRKLQRASVASRS